MFSLLNPISLWFGAALAVPLMIHFLGRQRLRRQPFPSLLLVRERFSRSMHKHRLKNLLLLLLRTLLILCLLLALGNPALESRQAAAKPDVSLALIHNGIYGSLHPGGAGKTGTAGEAGAENALQTQWLRLRESDSGAGGNVQAIPVIADGPGAQATSERFGDYGEAAGRLIAALGSRPGTARIQLPVFDWADAGEAKGGLLRSLQENPGLQIVFTDYTAWAGKVNAFAGLRATPSPVAPAVTLRARLSAAAAETGPGKVQVSLNGRLFQEVAAERGIAEVTLPLGEGPRTVGKVSLADAGFAVKDLHFCFPESGEWTLADSGSDLASLPSLGREAYFRRIVHVASPADIPWTGAGNGGKVNGGRGELRLVYLSAGRGAQPEAYARAVEFVKRGGRLIIGVGRESDVPLLNRFLLQPLRLGRLGNLVEASSNAPVNADRRALARLGRIPADIGSLGTVRKRFAFAPDSGVDVLLSQGGSAGSAGSPGSAGAGDGTQAVLAARDFHRGKVLLWTTDIDDLDWTDIGLNPLTPLLHQAFQENGSGDRAGNLAVASDSVYTAVLEAGGGGDGPKPAAEVRDPEGRPFTKVRTEGDRLRIGPFDKLGIYRVLNGKDTLEFAVNLALPASAGETGAVEKASQKEAREDFLKGFEAYRGRLAVVGPEEPAAVQASVRRLWPALLLAAILLLLLEGLISATFSLRRNRP